MSWFFKISLPPLFSIQLSSLSREVADSPSDLLVVGVFSGGSGECMDASIEGLRVQLVLPVTHLWKNVSRRHNSLARWNEGCHMHEQDQ